MLKVTIGASNSGKSTWAHEQWEKDPLNTIVVNRDKIRELLFGYNETSINEYYTRPDINTLEKQVTLFEDTLIHDGLNLNKTVIVDATHLKKAYLDRFKFFNTKVEYILFQEDLKTLLERNSKRNRKVDESVIKRQLNQLKSLEVPMCVEAVELNQDKSLPHCTILDLDGTVALKCDRDIYDGSKCHMDFLIEPVFNLIKDIENLIICTGRDDRFTKETKYWLDKHDIKYKEFHIRKYPDMRPDWIVKEEFWRDISQRYYIDILVDDRNQVCRRARALGLKVAQVEYGNF